MSCAQREQEGEGRNRFANNPSIDFLHFSHNPPGFCALWVVLITSKSSGAAPLCQWGFRRHVVVTAQFLQIVFKCSCHIQKWGVLCLMLAAAFSILRISVP